MLFCICCTFLRPHLILTAVRGISGGQKRRVTVAETFLSCARVYAGDEITNGLDSAVAVDVVRFFVRWARESGGTFVTALQAPTPEVTAAFDAVLVLAEGRVLYHVSVLFI